MSSRLGNWIIGLGVSVLFAGLCVLPSGFGKDADPSLLALGACMFSLGALSIAAGIYLKAKSIQSSNLASAVVLAPGARKNRSGCDLCGTEVPVVQCKVHDLSVCGTCLAQHYDLRSCIYVPASRKPLNKVTKPIAKSRGA